MRKARHSYTIRSTHWLFGGALVAVAVAGCSSAPGSATPPEPLGADQPLVCMGFTKGGGGDGCGSSSGGSGSGSGSGGATCGVANFPCCNGSECGVGSTCVSGTCDACGGLGEAVCPGSGCLSGAPLNGQCVLCGGLTQPACSYGCNAGADIGTTCLECSSVPVQVTLKSADPQSIDVSYQVSPPVPVPSPVRMLIQVTNAANPSDTRSIITAPAMTGDQHFSGLIPSATYNVSVSMYSTGCAPWTGSVATQTDTVTFGSGYMDLGNAGDGYASLQIWSNGNYTYSGHVHNAGFFSSDFSLAAASVWKDANGIPFSVADLGQLGGTESIGYSRDGDFNFSGNDSRIAANYLQIKPLQARFSLTLETDVGRALVDSLADLGIGAAAGVAVVFGGAAIYNCFANSQQAGCQAQPSGTSTSLGVDFTCFCSF